MFLFLLLAVFFLLHLGILWCFLRWLKSVSLKKPSKATVIISASVLFVLALCPILGMVSAIGDLRYIFMEVGNLWLGAIIFILMGVLAVALVTPMIRFVGKTKNLSRSASIISGAVIAVFTLAMLLGGAVHAKNIKVTPYNLDVQSESAGKLKVAFIADLHMGAQVGADMMEDMVDKINAMSPDLILIGGDIFNSNFSAIKEPERIEKAFLAMESTYGTYGVYGNHDVAEVLFGGFAISPKNMAFRDKEMVSFLKRSGVTMLEDSSVELDFCTIVGRLDGEKSGDGTQNRKSPEDLLKNVNTNKPLIVLEHEPDDLSILAEKGADVVLSGHTHNGQFFPLTIAQSRIWDNPYGMLKIDSTSNIVTSGVGFYGPPLRLFTDAEICEITINYKPAL